MDKGQQTLESMSMAPAYNQWILKKFSKYLKGDILEIGSGIGNFTKLLVKYGDVWASDISKDYIQTLKQEISELKGVGIADIEKGKYYFNSSPSVQKKFDVIVCLNVVEHIKNDEQALMNLHKLLKPKGVLILIVPSGMNLYGKIDQAIGHYRRYNKAKLQKQLQKIGFKILKSRLLNFIGGLGWFFSGKVLKQTTVKKHNVKIFNLISPAFLLLERFWEPPLATSVFIIARKN
jgi:2-polyprenyl-3-methyl-5-hydroxy-6-metoxy-1,4-benzoquinol methylase